MPLPPVSIKLKTTLDTPRARHIIRKAEKDLLQARIKAINNILEQVDRESQDCRDKLASIISQERLEQCQDFINKVSELRFNKVKQRQINKLNHLVTKKEGNITINSNNITLNRLVLVQSPPNPHNPTPATALLPPGEGDNSPPATAHPPLEGNSSLNNLASNSNTTSNSVNSVSNQTISQGPSHNQTPAIAHLPPGEGSNPPRELYSFPQKLTALPFNFQTRLTIKLLVKDNTLKERTVMDVEDIILLLEFCLKNTYFSFQGQFYEQVEGAAMGSPVSPIVANLYMEYLEQKALSTAPNPPKFWGRYVDDTFVIHKEANKQSFLQHINSVDPAIRFTVEDNKEDGSIPFLDTIVKPEADGSLSITVYRKPTHTDQYLQWDSHHHLSAKFSVIQTLSHRASTVCSNPELLQKEKQHLRKALTKCNYPKWALDKVEKRLNRSTRQVNDGGNNSAQPANHGVQSKGHIVIPYTQGLCESIKKICGRYGIQTHFKGGKTIKNLLVSPKDKDPMLNQSGAIYRYQCNNLGCDDEYIGETSRTFGERYKEHLKAPSAIHHHSTITGHTTNHNNFQIIGREGHNLARNIKESIYIRVNNPSLNNNTGKFNLSHIWDRVLLNTKGLTLK